MQSHSQIAETRAGLISELERATGEQRLTACMARVCLVSGLERDSSDLQPADPGTLVSRLEKVSGIPTTHFLQSRG